MRQVCFYPPFILLCPAGGKTSPASRHGVQARIPFQHSHSGMTAADALSQARRRAVVASIVGNGFEWYDFLVYGFLAGIIAPVFFPASDPGLSLLMASGSFAVSFVVRPAGGMLFAIYADRRGRKPALTLMLALMAGSTMAIGLIPSHASIGLAAPLLLIAARMVQGLSVGAEFATATAMLTEWAPRRARMRHGSLQMCTQAFAMALAAASVAALSSLLDARQMSQWGWRLPFLAGALIGPVGFYLRRSVPESPAFQPPSPQGRKGAQPLSELLERHRARVLAGLGIVVIGTASQYVWFVYLPVFVTGQLGLDVSAAMTGSALCGLLLVGLTFGVGVLADRWGPWPLFTTGAAAFGMLAWPLLAYVLAAPSLGSLLVAQAMCTIAISLIWGPTPGLLASLYPVRMRSTGIALCYNLGVLLFGGLAPFTLTWTTRMFDDRMMPAYYITVCAAIALAATSGQWLRPGNRHTRPAKQDRKAG
jgi:MFS family permease